LQGEDFAAGPGRAPAAGEDGGKYSAGDARSNVHAVAAAIVAEALDNGWPLVGRYRVQGARLVPESRP